MKSKEQEKKLILEEIEKVWNHYPDLPLFLVLDMISGFTNNNRNNEQLLNQLKFYGRNIKKRKS